MQADIETREADAWRRRLIWLIPLLFAVVSLAIRLPALDRLAVVDEGFWLGRSLNFAVALRDADPAGTYQFVHPGVTLMWLGALGYWWADPDLVRALPEPLDARRPPILSTLRAMDRDPLELLIALRTVKIIAETAVLALASWYAIRLFGLGAAAFAFGLVALEPYVIGHGRLLHLDSLMASLMLLSALGLATALHAGGRLRDVAVAGIAAGLAWLTRSPAIFLIPWTLLVIGMAAAWPPASEASRPRRLRWRRAGARLGTWSVAAMATTLLLWPALWVGPVDVAREMAAWTLDAAAEGHHRSTFFRGQIFDGDPGWSFYPVNLAWRLTPVVMAGVGLTIVALVWRRGALIPAARRRPVAELTLYAVAFITLLSLGAKKFDRYALPGALALVVVAGVGWYGVARLVGRSRQPWGRRAALAVALASSGLVVWGAVRSGPYYLDAFSPLLGGPSAAVRIVPVGWGEGMDQVAAFIAAQPEGHDAVIRIDGWRESLAVFLPNTITEGVFPPTELGRQRWEESDYFVTYVAMWQRQTLHPEVAAVLAAHEPVFTVTIDGLAFARVYDLRQIAPPEGYFPA